MITALILAAVFGGTLLLIVAGYHFANRKRAAELEAVRSRLMGGGPAANAAATVSILKQDKVSRVAFLNRLLTGRSFTAVLTQELQRAGSRRSPGEFVLIIALCGAIAALLGGRVNPFVASFLGAIGTALPILNLKRLQGARRKKFEGQLPEAIDMLVNAMKAGYSLQAAMKFIGDETADPLGPEFTRFYDEQRLGMDVRTALLRLQERQDSLDLKMFVTALLIQRESGGNLAEVMTNLSTLMRERAAIRGEIDTLTAEPKMSAVVLTGLPVVLFAVINVINPDYLMPLYTTPMGKALLVYSAVSVLVGFIMLRKIGTIDV